MKNVTKKVVLSGLLNGDGISKTMLIHAEDGRHEQGAISSMTTDGWEDENGFTRTIEDVSEIAHLQVDFVDIHEIRIVVESLACPGVNTAVALKEYAKDFVGNLDTPGTHLLSTDLAIQEVLPGKLQENGALEPFFDLSASFGFMRGRGGAYDIIEHLGGNHGVMQMLVEWASEFEGYWLSLSEDDREDYYIQIDEFFDKKITEFRATM